MSSENGYPSSSQQDGADGAASWNGTVTRPTVAAFSPNQQTDTGRRSRASIIIHQKSPLLIATPPQVTRALAYSHPFILPLNKFAGLLSWTTDDPWESFLLVATFWFVVQYGDVILRWTGPLVLVVGLIMGMYSRRYSPLSSTVWSGNKSKHARKDSENVRKSLDEILETLQAFTARCDVLLDPFLRLTEFLSTQSTATSATTRPALTTLFLRILALIPFWIVLTLPPLRLITTKRTVLVVGTLILSWHSRPARVSRSILWRSRSARALCSLITGLDLNATLSSEIPPPLPPRNNDSQVATKAEVPGVRFTFSLYENQRRWLGLGWTSSLLAYERQAWTDEHMNTCPDPSNFKLPGTDNGTTQWRWVDGSEWVVSPKGSSKGKDVKRDGIDAEGWTYYDTKWQHPLKEDGWGRYTRRRQWVRDAELVEVEPIDAAAVDQTSDLNEKDAVNGPAVDNTVKRRRGWLPRRGSASSPARSTLDNDKSDAVSKTGSGKTGMSTRSKDDDVDDLQIPNRYRNTDMDRSIGDGLAEGLS